MFSSGAPKKWDESVIFEILLPNCKMSSKKVATQYRYVFLVLHVVNYSLCDLLVQGEDRVCHSPTDSAASPGEDVYTGQSEDQTCDPCPDYEGEPAALSLAMGR